MTTNYFDLWQVWTHYLGIARLVKIDLSGMLRVKRFALIIRAENGFIIREVLILYSYRNKISMLYAQVEAGVSQLAVAICIYKIKPNVPFRLFSCSVMKQLPDCCLTEKE